MTGFLFWVIGSFFFLLGLFCLFVAVLMFSSWRQGIKRAPAWKFLLWTYAGIGSEGLMVVFYTCKPCGAVRAGQ
ncbi:hypothetical protein [Streptomyces sp. NPDC050392]|uniref:hypothetical protein n=1 Tax=Streptomyces sp. NPDC050392 TaxID=3155782 RepID=UPI00341EFF6F